MGDGDHDARTIHCGNLPQEKITEELLYELFLQVCMRFHSIHSTGKDFGQLQFFTNKFFIYIQAGPLERVSIPKDNGKNRSYAFITYRYQVSVPYALSVFSGTKMFNRELRLNNRNMNRTNDNTGINMNIKGHSQNRGQAPMEPRPLLPNAPLTHQFQMQNPFGNAALRGGNNFLAGASMNPMNNLMPPMAPMPRMDFSGNQPFDIQSLLQFGGQMQLMGNNDFGSANNSGNPNDGHRHQSKIMHRHENRSHNQNQNYSRDDRRNDRRRDRSRSRSRERKNDDWMRNRGRKNDRHDRGKDHRGNNNQNRRR